MSLPIVEHRDRAAGGILEVTAGDAFPRGDSRPAGSSGVAIPFQRCAGHGFEDAELARRESGSPLLSVVREHGLAQAVEVPAVGGIGRVVAVEGQHPRIERLAQELADPPQLSLRLGQQVLVAHLHERRFSQDLPGLLCRGEIADPVSRHVVHVLGSEGRRSEGEGDIAPVAHQVDRLEVGKAFQYRAPEQGVMGRLLTPACLALGHRPTPQQRLHDAVKVRP